MRHESTGSEPIGSGAFLKRESRLLSADGLSPEQRIQTLSSDFLELVFTAQGDVRLVSRDEVLAWFKQARNEDRWVIMNLSVHSMSTSGDRVMTQYRVEHWRPGRNGPSLSDHLSLWQQQDEQWLMLFHQSLPAESFIPGISP